MSKWHMTPDGIGGFNLEEVGYGGGGDSGGCLSAVLSVIAVVLIKKLLGRFGINVPFWGNIVIFIISFGIIGNILENDTVRYGLYAIIAIAILFALFMLGKQNM